jgi:hypothetical protein
MDYGALSWSRVRIEASSKSLKLRIDFPGMQAGRHGAKDPGCPASLGYLNLVKKHLTMLTTID